jgi:hypothetical protein
MTIITDILSVVWLALFVVGTFQYLRRLRLSWTARKVLQKRGLNGALKIVATSRIQSFLFRIIILETIGGSAMIFFLYQSDAPLYLLLLYMFRTITALTLVIWAEVDTHNTVSHAHVEEIRLARALVVGYETDPHIRDLAQLLLDALEQKGLTDDV